MSRAGKIQIAAEKPPSQSGMRRWPQVPGRASNTPAQGVPQPFAEPAVADGPGGDLVPVAPDQLLAAAVAIGAAAGLVVDVAGVDVAQAVAHGDLARAGQGRARGRRHVQHLVVGMEGREVERHVGPEMLHEPGAERLDLGRRVVLPRNEERRDFEPDVGLVLEIDQRVEHGLERARAELLVEALGERLEVDVGGVHVAVELGARLGAHVAGRDGDVREPARAAGVGHVDRVFQEDDRVVVGVGDRAAAAPLGRERDPLGRGPLLQTVERAGLGDVPVLAELAGQIAARGAEGEHRRARQEVVERLLLDRIDAETRGATVGGQQQLIAPARTHEAEAPLALVQPAIARADVALNAAVVQPVPVAGRDTFNQVALHAT